MCAIGKINCEFDQAATHRIEVGGAIAAMVKDCLGRCMKIVDGMQQPVEFRFAHAREKNHIAHVARRALGTAYPLRIGAVRLHVGEFLLISLCVDIVIR